MKNLYDAIHWHEFYIGADASVSEIPVVIGEVGTGAPVALITAGVHGDEGPWGAWAIRQLLSQTNMDDLVGTIRVVPNANPLAMQADARNAPLDTLDLNRSFPGDRDGSHTERLAALLVDRALANVDVAIDLHGGGSWCVNALRFPDARGRRISASVWRTLYGISARSQRYAYGLCSLSRGASGRCRNGRSQPV